MKSIIVSHAASLQCTLTVTGLLTCTRVSAANDDDILEVSNGSTRERRRSLDPFEDLN